MRKLLIYILSSAISLGLFGQGNITLNSPQLAGTQIACQSISLTSGFSFSASGTNSLTLKVDASLCDPYEGAPIGLSSDRNFTRTRTYTTVDGSRYLDQVQYFDGLGRPVQTVQRGITPSTGDMVNLQEYDGFGRDDKAWLPAVISGNNGAYVNPETVKSAAISINGNDQKPYSQPVYETSPLSRIVKQYSPGADWHKTYVEKGNTGESKYNSTNYKTNSGTYGVLSCALFTVERSGASVKMKKNDYYSSGELYVTEVKDEDDNTFYEFKDKLGQIILIRQIEGSTSYDTYYIYDDLGNLCFVLPPLASEIHITNNGTVYDETNSTPIKQYAYIYKYDDFNRCIAKKLPGCEWIYYVYDKADQIIFTQDGEQRKDGKNEWTFTIPDALGRVVLTGISKDTISVSHKVVKGMYTSSGSYMRYNILVDGVNKLFTNTPSILSVNYYDNYDFRGMPEIPSSGTEYLAESGYGVLYYIGGYKGLLTGTLTAQLNKIDASSPDFLYSVMYYDEYNRLIQAKSNNHLGGLEKEYIAYNFTGQPTQKKHIHTKGTNNAGLQAEVYSYTYDHAGRLLKTMHQLTDGTTVKPQVTLAENSYDELGRLATNKKGGRSELNTTYAYNVRSWKKSISSPLFNQTLYYNESYGGSAKRYNGNIAEMTWKVWDSATNKWEKERGYGFTYDNLSRLTVANYLENGMVNTNYRTSYSYDKHGNLITLNQRGLKDASSYGQVDSLKMTYSGNQLTKVTDAVPNFAYAASADFKNYGGSNAIYTYNLNGAMATDSHKGILEIKYNSLNLPYELLIKNTEVSGKVYYTYSASGAKLKTKHMKAKNLGYTPVTGTAGDTNLDVIKTTDYVGSMVYENDSLKRVLVDGGYIEVTRVNGVNQYAYNYYLTDHLGNNRVVANARGIPIQRNHYYPFGMTFAESTTQEQGKQPYKYNGKELDQTHGLNMYDYSARFYEPAIGRFTTVDPHAEKYYSWSPYHYAANNPIRITDPTGMSWSFEDGGGNGDRVLPRTDKRSYGNSTWGNIGTFAFNTFASFTNVVWDTGDQLIQEGRFIYNNGVGPYLKNAGTSMANTVSRMWNYTINTPLSTQLKGEWKLMQNPDYWSDGLGQAAWMGLPLKATGGTRALVPTIETPSMMIGPPASKLGGRLGNAATRNQIDQISTILEGRGYKIEFGGQRGFKEEYLKPLGGGRSGGSYLDITASHPKYGTLRINTVDTYSSGLPTLRELNNATRIRQQINSGEHLLLIPKTK